MKKVILLLAAAISMLAFNSCKDSDDTPEEPSVESPNYLVMVYGVGGGNLDNGILANIIQAIDEGGDENIKMTFLFNELCSPGVVMFPMNSESYDNSQQGCLLYLGLQRGYGILSGNRI